MADQTDTTVVVETPQFYVAPLDQRPETAPENSIFSAHSGERFRFQKGQWVPLVV